MTCHRRYLFEYPDEWTAGGYAKILAVLQHACEANSWYNEPKVEGEPYGRLSFAFTVSARDQWWAHRRAMNLATDCFLSVGMGSKHIPDPMWEPLEPHTNRGHYRLPKEI